MESAPRPNSRGVNPRGRFNRFVWERWLQDEGPYGQLSRVQLALLMLMARSADADGVSYWGKTAAAERCGCGVDAVRVAYRALEQQGLIRLVERGGVRGQRRASRYRIIMHKPDADLPAQPPATQPDAAPGPIAVSGWTGPPDAAPASTSSPTTGLRHKPRGGCARRPEGAAPQAPRSPKRKPAEQTRARCAPCESAGLFESPQCTARAAAAALIDFGFAPNVARGLVGEHKPTADQVRTVIANARAWEQAAKLGKRGPLNNPIGFVRSQIAQRLYEPDPAVLAQARRAEAQANAQQAHRDREQARAREADRLARAEAIYGSMDPDARQQMHDQLNAGLAQKAKPWRLRQWSIESIAEGLT